MTFAVLSPIFGLIGLTFLLRDVIPTGQVSYAEYILPAVVVQAMLFGALTTTDRAAWDKSSGLGTRMRTLPISRFTPLMARMTYALIRGVAAMAASVVAAGIFGFRLHVGLGYLVAFVALALVLTLGLSFGADAAGNKAARTEVASQLLMVPQLLIVMLSTGFAPVDAFPTWLHGFVRYQPISQITETMRGFLAGHTDPANLGTSLAWCVGLLIVFGAISVRLQGRTS